jgi:FtsZ-interacting cell division protein ZipA
MEARVSSMGTASSMREKGVDVSSSYQYPSPPQQQQQQQQQQQSYHQHQQQQQTMQPVIPLVDSYGQMNQQSILTAPAVPPLVPQAQFQPQPYQQQTDSSTSPGDSRQNSVTSGQLFAGTNAGNTNGGDVLMDDIDWVSISFPTPLFSRTLLNVFAKNANC